MLRSSETIHTANQVIVSQPDVLVVNKRLRRGAVSVRKRWSDQETEDEILKKYQ